MDNVTPSENLEQLESKLKRLEWFKTAKVYYLGKEPQPLIPKEDIIIVDQQIEVIQQKIKNIIERIRFFGEAGAWTK